MEMGLALLKYYSFDLGSYTVADLARAWQKYDSEWLRHAVIECLYRGRYKAVSVHQILQQWTRRGEPLYHYSKDFERFICHDVPLQMRQASDNLLYFANQAPSDAATLFTTGNSATDNPKIESTTGKDPTVPDASAKSNASSSRTTMGRRSGAKRYPEKQMPGLQSSQPLPHIEPKSYRADVYGTALEDMRLLAKASVFTNKLRSMCQDITDPASTAEESMVNDSYQSSPTDNFLLKVERPNAEEVPTKIVTLPLHNQEDLANLASTELELKPLVVITESATLTEPTSTVDIVKSDKSDLDSADNAISPRAESEDHV